MHEQKTIRRKGRPTKLTRKTHALIVKYIKAGNYMETAAVCAGVWAWSVRKWLARGAEEGRRLELGEEPRTDERIYYHFWCDVTEAIAVSEVRLIGIITKAAETDWKAAVEMIQRRWPKRWGTRINMTVEQELTEALDKLEKALSDEEFQKVLEALSADTPIDTTT